MLVLIMQAAAVAAVLQRVSSLRTQAHSKQDLSNTVGESHLS